MVNVYELTLGCRILKDNTEIEVNKIEVDKINFVIERLPVKRIMLDPGILK